MDHLRVEKKKILDAIYESWVRRLESFNNDEWTQVRDEKDCTIFLGKNKKSDFKSLKSVLIFKSKYCPQLFIKFIEEAKQQSHLLPNDSTTFLNKLVHHEKEWSISHHGVVHNKKKTDFLVAQCVKDFPGKDITFFYGGSIKNSGKNIKGTEDIEGSSRGTMNFFSWKAKRINKELLKIEYMENYIPQEGLSVDEHSEYLIKRGQRVGAFARTFVKWIQQYDKIYTWYDYKSKEKTRSFKGYLFEGCDSLTSALFRSIEVYSDNKAIAYREVKSYKSCKVENAEGVLKDKELPLFGPVHYKTYAEWGKEIIDIAKGIKKWSNMKIGEIIGLFCPTRYEWMQVYHAALRQRYVCTTAYKTLGRENLIKIINSTEMKTIFTNSEDVSFLESIHKEIPTLKNIIYVRDARDLISKRKITSENYKIIELKDILELGKGIDEKIDVKIPSGDDLAVILFTSGTTGDPKGVKMKHDNLLSSVTATIHHCFVNKNDVHLAYLPLAHIFEQYYEHTILLTGGLCGYGSPKTLADTMVAPPSVGDLIAFRPTMFIVVPRVLETMRKKIEFKISNASMVKKLLFKLAYKWKLDYIYKKHEEVEEEDFHKRKETSKLFDKLVFKKFKDLFGGRVRLLGSGAANFPGATQEFFQVLLHPEAVVRQGWGSTECCGGQVYTPLEWNFFTGAVGVPGKGIELKIRSIPSMNYYVTDKPYPRGEMLLRGKPICTSGYFKQPEKTKKSFTEDGFYCSEDVITLDKKGLVYIIDRKSNHFKLVNGKFVAPEKLESIYGLSSFVAPNGIYIYSDGFHNSLVAVVVIDISFILKWAKSKGIGDGDIKKIMKSDVLRKEILKDFEALAKKYGKSNYERIVDIYITDDEWTPQNKLLSNTMKLKRANLKNKYAEKLKKLLI